MDGNTRRLQHIRVVPTTSKHQCPGRFIVTIPVSGNWFYARFEYEWGSKSTLKNIFGNYADDQQSGPIYLGFDNRWPENRVTQK